ncbi:GDYXXLXY domain-containing protein [Bacillus marasmi]|uniref:GDYXXLXY domain-containing protein n=1 Tax=Bacillus marasmi TaxID=1926279 RepID=UPI0011C6F957|nr:GDYXXLXY domain-containing protein [Bacillus marasmi]
MNKRTKYFVLACLVPILVLIGMTVTPLYTLYKGQEIVLATVPVDPSDPFRGDYVSLRFEAEEIPLELVEQEILDKRNELNGTRVYVSLTKENGVHRPSKVSLQKPEKGIYMKGNFQYIGPAWDRVNQKETEDVLFIEYSLDKYFVEDNTGLEWERASMKGDILAKAKVFNGYAYLLEIELKE